MEFHKYEPLPGNLADELMGSAEGEREEGNFLDTRTVCRLPNIFWILLRRSRVLAFQNHLILEYVELWYSHS